MRLLIAFSIVSFGLISTAARANNIQLDRRQFLVGTGAVAAAPMVPGSSSALPEMASAASLTSRVEYLTASARFFRVMSPREMDFIFRNTLVKAFKDGNDTLINHPWYWGKYIATEFVEGELEIARKLKIPLESVQAGSDNLMNPRRFLPDSINYVSTAKHDPSLGREYLETYVRVIDRRIPGYGRSLSNIFKYIAKHHATDAPDWLLDYASHMSTIEHEFAELGPRAVIRYSNLIDYATVKVDPPPPQELGWQRIAGATRRAVQSCASLMRSFVAEKIEGIEAPAPVLKLPAPEGEESNSARAESEK
jgi:hypothetical protein